MNLPRTIDTLLRPGGAPPTEAEIRPPVRSHALESTGHPSQTLDEFWIPVSNERADVVSISTRLAAFEIKSHRDTLARLPRQAAAFERVFEQCTAVVSTRHLDEARSLLSGKWGIIEISSDSGAMLLHRPALDQPALDLEIVVRLLWRDVAFQLLEALKLAPKPTATRPALWRTLLREVDGVDLYRLICETLLNRPGSAASIPTRRFKTVSVAAG
jgi:hypothetical protein